MVRIVFFLAIVGSYCLGAQTRSRLSGRERRRARRGRRAAHPAAFLPGFERRLLGGPVAAQTCHQVVEIDLVSVEVGAVDTSEPDLLGELHAAAATHAGAGDPG